MQKRKKMFLTNFFKKMKKPRREKKENAVRQINKQTNKQKYCMKTKRNQDFTFVT